MFFLSTKRGHNNNLPSDINHSKVSPILPTKCGEDQSVEFALSTEYLSAFQWAMRLK